jgi:adenylate kinase
MLCNVISVIGPPTAGKTTLTRELGQLPDGRVFRLREHVPEDILAATATNAERLGWIDDLTVITIVHEYTEKLIREGEIHMLLLDSFPGRATQVSLFLTILRQLAPGCIVRVIELVADPAELHRRATSRRVCDCCERDPLCDPRLPAEASMVDPRRCGRCNHLLHVRRGDVPAVYKARMRRYYEVAEGMRCAFSNAGITVTRLDNSRSFDATAQELASLLV